MKNLRPYGIAAAGLVLAGGLAFGLSKAVASGPQAPLVAAVVPLDASGNGSAKAVWIVDTNGSAKYCVAGKLAPAGKLPAPNCSPWNTTRLFALPPTN